MSVSSSLRSCVLLSMTNRAARAAMAPFLSDLVAARRAFDVTDREIVIIANLSAFMTIRRVVDDIVKVTTGDKAYVVDGSKGAATFYPRGGGRLFPDQRLGGLLRSLDARAIVSMWCEADAAGFEPMPGVIRMSLSIEYHDGGRLDTCFRGDVF